MVLVSFRKCGASKPPSETGGALQQRLLQDAEENGSGVIFSPPGQHTCCTQRPPHSASQSQPSLVLVKLLSFKAFLCLHLRGPPPPFSPPHIGHVAPEDSHHPGPPLVPHCHSLPESPALLDFESLLTLTLLKRPLRAWCSPPHIPPMCLTPQCRPLFSICHSTLITSPLTWTMGQIHCVTRKAWPRPWHMGTQGG